MWPSREPMRQASCPGDISACAWVKKACSRQIADLDQKDFAYRYDEKKAAFGVSTTAHAISQVRTASRFQALSAEGNSLDGLNMHCAIVRRASRAQDAQGVRCPGNCRGRAAAASALAYHNGRIGQERDLLRAENVSDKDPRWGREGRHLLRGDLYDRRRGRLEQSGSMGQSQSQLRRLGLSGGHRPAVCEGAQDAERPEQLSHERLSVWVNADSAFFSMTELAQCINRRLKAQDFLGESCWIGIDPASRRDIAPRMMLFRRGKHFYAFGRYFLPESEIEESKNSQYSGWEKEGWITATPGNITDFGYIEEDLSELASRYPGRGSGHDPFQATQFATRCWLKVSRWSRCGL